MRQEWDYFLGIASVKRQQGLFQGTMVAQGAFSVYRTAALNGVGGWPDRIGEDIVLTWAMMREGGRVGYERTAIAFTGAPEDARTFAAAAPLGARDRGPARARRPAARRRSSQRPRRARQLRLPLRRRRYSIAFPIGISMAGYAQELFGTARRW